MSASFLAPLVRSSRTHLDTGSTRVVTSVKIERLPAVVFDFVSTPENWPLWHPASLAVEGGAGRGLRAGESVTEVFRILWQTGRTQWRVVRCKAMHTWKISAATPEGEATITYRLIAEGAHTRFIRMLHYRARSRLWRIADRLFAARAMERQSAQSLRNLKRVIESEKTSLRNQLWTDPGQNRRGNQESYSVTA